MPTPPALHASELRRVCDPSIFKFDSTADIAPLDEVIGQERAVRAITLGLEMNQPGYNIFITGLEGSGKRTIAQDIVSLHARKQITPDDWCMVNNFDDEFRPKAICVPTGKATIFAKSIDRLIRMLRVKLPKEFESDAFKEKVNQLQIKSNDQEKAIIDRLDQFGREHNVHIAKSAEGFQPLPLVEEKPMTAEQFRQLNKEQQEAVNAALKQVGAEIEEGIAEIVKIKQSYQKAMERLSQQTALLVIGERMKSIRSEYGDCKQIIDHLDAIQQHIIEELEVFIDPDNHQAKAPEGPFALSTSPFNPYRVNVLVDHKYTKGAPAVFEPNPSFQNLFGYIDKKTFMGATTTDFSMVQAGSLLQANGGYLIIEAESVLMEEYTWEALKRSLQNKELYIQDIPRGPGMMTGGLRPEPIPLEIKVILVGNYHTFELLQNHDPKFNKTFKVRADFDYVTDLSESVAQLYAQFIARVCKENNLRHFTPDAVSAIVEFGSKAAENQSKLSLRFGPIVGLIQESDYWARQEEAELVTEAHIVKAMNEYRFRYNLYEEKVHDKYADDTILIDTDGGVVGQVNALAVYQIGEISFGRPSRITAETFMGKHSIVNIEREAKMSGRTHDKGVMILSGYLGRTFAQNYPLSLSISITFEQSYSGVDGDSASSTELYAILSSLSGLPIQQGIAVTGSVNQKGQIQAIGGVNQKIEGFFEVCKTKGFTDRQGVLIPKANVKNLMLKREVVQAVEKGQFHIYPVETIEQGMAILTTVPTGTPDEHGIFPPDTVFGKVQEKLRQFLDQSMKFKTWSPEGSTR